MAYKFTPQDFKGNVGVEDENFFNNLNRKNIEGSELNYKDIKIAREICYNNKKFEEDLEILSYLNSGSCGVVYLGEIRRNFSKKVALKLLVSNKITKSKREKNSKKEVHIMNKLKFKNSINLYGIYEVSKQKDIICLVMEYAKYGDLENFQRLIQKKTFNETLLAYIAYQVLVGLLHCKNSNIVHMDIKHQNLLIDENLTVKLSDFSVSYEINGCDKNSYIILPTVGTSLFMSPEVLSKKKIKVDDANKVDSYCLGVLLYNLAFNSYPYDLKHSDKKNFDEIFRKIISTNLKIPEFTKHSILFRQFLSKILSNRIENRYSIEEALNDRWIIYSQTIFEEKEKINDLEKFLINIVTDNIRCFNDKIRSKESEKF